ncbi:MAG: P-loop NTPase [Deltaproteobacteria bacterium]|nr:P-loop NTPase [Deltaproteobacteria bacterium]
MAHQSHVNIWSIGGGKGGVGKSMVTIGLGISLARLGNRVILLDGDFGGANLHTLMGLRFPAVTLEDFLLRKVARLDDVVMPSPIDGISLICGADDILGVANPTYHQKIRLLRELEELPADFLLIDLAAGTSINILDLFNHSPGKIAVFTGYTTSLQNVYGFIKCALFRQISQEFAKDKDVSELLRQEGAGDEEVLTMDDLVDQVRSVSPEKSLRLLNLLQEFKVFLVTNMVKTEQDARSAEIIQKVCADFLNITPPILGSLPFDPLVEKAVNRMALPLLYQKKNPFLKSLDEIANRMVCLPRSSTALPSEKENSASKTSSGLLKETLQTG